MENKQDILKKIITKVDRVEPSLNFTDTIMHKILENKHLKSYSQNKPLLSKKQIWGFSFVPILILLISIFGKDSNSASQSTKFDLSQYISYFKIEISPIYMIIAISLFLFLLLDYFIKEKVKS